MADKKLSALTELAATPASDDELYIRDVSEAASAESKRITVTNLMGASAATKEFFATATYGTRVYFRHSFAGCEVKGVDEVAHCTFRIPNDFSSIVTVELIVAPMATQAAANWDIYSSYAGDGETYNLHTESDAATTYNVTLNEQYAIDISGILSSLAVDDLVGIYLVQKTTDHNVFVFGVRFRYS